MEEREKKKQKNNGVALDAWEEKKGKSEMLLVGHLLN